VNVATSTILLARPQLINTHLGLKEFYVSTALPFRVWQMNDRHDTILASLEVAAGRANE
jgi:ABC-type maltose transport system permease subunit